MKIIVASKNPVKINAVQIGFQSFGKNSEIEGVTIDSEVAGQPMSDAETLKGARIRVKNARKKYPEADFWIGIEGGVERKEDKLDAFAWVVIQGIDAIGESRTTTFSLPHSVRELIDQGYELGTANDIIFKKHNSKQQSGAVGLLTNDVISRTELYVQAVQLALIPIINAKMYGFNDR